MVKKIELPSTPRHVRIFDEDWLWLMQNYGPGTPGEVGVSNAVRKIVHAKVQAMRGQVNSKLDQGGGKS